MRKDTTKRSVQRMQVQLVKERYGFTLRAENGQEVFIQSDWDYPGTASNLGFVPCECGETDGTVDCAHHTATEMISAAYDFLCEHDGETFTDPGYF
jgi:hypothetical protein